MRKICFYFRAAFHLLYTVLLMPKVKRAKKRSYEEGEELIHKYVKNWARATMKATGLNIKVQGKEKIPEGPCLYIANHQSIIDIPLLIDVVDGKLGAVAKKELENVPILSYWCRAIHCVFMDRNNIREGLKSIQQATENLKNGSSMLIFPEGTRSKGGKMKDFKKGSLKMAMKANVPIIPVTIEGTYKICEGYDKWDKKDNDCICIIHDPIYPKDLTREEQQGLSEKCKEIIEKSLDNLNKK